MITQEFIINLERIVVLREDEFNGTIEKEQKEELIKLKDYFMDWFLK